MIATSWGNAIVANRRIKLDITQLFGDGESIAIPGDSMILIHF